MAVAFSKTNLLTKTVIIRGICHSLQAFFPHASFIGGPYDDQNTVYFLMRNPAYQAGVQNWRIVRIIHVTRSDETRFRVDLCTHTYVPIHATLHMIENNQQATQTIIKLIQTFDYTF